MDRGSQMIDELVEQYLTERKKKVDPLTQYWKDYSSAYQSEDYYENEGSRKGVSTDPYKKKQEEIIKKVTQEYGTDVAKAMEKHAVYLADVWYMGYGGKKSAATKLRKKYNIDWDGDV